MIILTPEPSFSVSQLSGTPVDEIDDEHPEVVAYSDISTGELVHKLWLDASRQKIERFHEACGLEFVEDVASKTTEEEAAVEEELVRARDSARGLKEALGKRLPVDGEVAVWWSSLCCLVASAPDFGALRFWQMFT